MRGRYRKVFEIKIVFLCFNFLEGNENDRIKKFFKKLSDQHFFLLEKV